MRLLRDRRGNTLVIGTMAIFPLAGLVGGGLDMSRIYITRTRLQHACDAGALAGRRAMGAGGWAHDGFAARTVADDFFRANWKSGSYGTQPITPQFTEADGVVTGAMSTDVPMTLMRIFGETTRNVTVTCQSEMRLLNTDVMFVLDTTGSMTGILPGDTQSKMAALRVAVKCFFETLAQQDIIDQVCGTGAPPSGGVAPGVQLRFGFVPYSSNVNVGRLLPVNALANSWPYQTRVYQGSRQWTGWSQMRDGSNNLIMVPPKSNGECPNTPNAPANTEYRYTKTNVGGVQQCVQEQRFHRPLWRYAQTNVDISGLKSGTTFNNGFTRQQIGDELENEQITWDGCIEERQTVRATNYTPIPAGANDLNIDMLPVNGAVATQWGPVLPQLTFWRRLTPALSGQLNASQPRDTIDRYYRGGYSYSCPTAARRLRSYNVGGGPNDFMNYVNSLTPAGNTYHDIGMIWGQRLASPTGLFAADNALTPSGGAIERHLIFMTDGDTNTSPYDHTAYGLAWYDRRQTNANEGPAQETLDAQVDARFEALCTRGRGPFTIWVIGFGDISDDTVARLTRCASPGRFLRANNGSELSDAFRTIAEQIGQLRLRS